MCTGAIIVLVFYSTHYSFKIKDGENLLSLALMHGYSKRGKSNKAEAWYAVFGHSLPYFEGLFTLSPSAL